MKTFSELNSLQKLNAILAKHNRTIVSDGRLLTVIHKPAKGSAEVSRHPNVAHIAQAYAHLDDKLTALLV